MDSPHLLAPQASRGVPPLAPTVDDDSLYSELVELLDMDEAAQPALEDGSGEDSRSSEPHARVKEEPERSPHDDDEDVNTNGDDDATDPSQPQVYVRRSARFQAGNRNGYDNRRGSTHTPKPASPPSKPKQATHPVLVRVQREAETLAQVEAAKLPRPWNHAKRKPDGMPLSAKARKQRRLIRNRMSAHLHRERKKAYVTTLERTLLQFSEENTQLRHELAELRAAAQVPM